MEKFLSILIIVLLLSVFLILFYFLRKIEKLKTKDEGGALLMLQQQINQFSQTLDRKLSETNTLTKDQLKDSSYFIQGISRESRELLNEVSKQSQRMIREVTEKLTKLDETNRRVVDFSSQLKDLQDILKNPKQRGILGEYYLEETLKNVLPPNSYEMQYKLGITKEGKTLIPDAVVKIKDKLVPVDSKFSLEHYEKLINCKEEQQRETFKNLFKQDLKNRIDETAKYVRPDMQTVDFAFMFIPSESIYYDLLTDNVGSVNARNLIVYAFQEKHVIIVSPTSFLAYLQTVLQGLRALEIEESAKLIQKNVEKLAKHIKSYEIYHQKLGNSLATAVNHYNKTAGEFKKIDKDVMRVTDGKAGGEIQEIEIEKPKLEE
ncbi:MAG: DNA recombination protein RmuC [Candidatus Moranbacteria bacterium]|nr:DNA recombination protein RmuC [Candidatus Moranbacteria bacterium]